MYRYIYSGRRTAFVASLIVLTGIALWAAYNLLSLIATSRATTDTNKIDRVVDRMAFLMSNAETDERAYLITGQEKYLRSFRDAVGHNGLFAQLETLRQLTQREPQQQRNLDTLEPLLHARVREMQMAVEVRQQQGLDAARSVVKHNLMLKTSDKIRALIGDMQDREDARLSEQTHQRDVSAQRSIWSFIVSGSLVVGLLSTSIGALQREIVQRRRSEEKVCQLNCELESRVQRRTEHLEQAQQQIQCYVEELESLNVEMIERLARAGEFRDDDTGHHTQRVGSTARLLAQKLGLPAESIQQIQYAARLHDLGKIGVSDLILLKPGKLTDEEFALMKEHTTIGEALFQDGHSELMRMSQRIAASHHERWDGTGYPHKLQGEAIPLEARLVAVADVFDALTHERPYKQAWSVPEAVTEIMRQSGRQFDPQAVEAFCSLHHEALI